MTTPRDVIAPAPTPDMDLRQAISEARADIEAYLAGDESRVTVTVGRAAPARNRHARRKAAALRRRAASDTGGA